MSDSCSLSEMNPDAFEHMVNALAIRVLGAGHTGFGPGSDGGRDGYFEGEAEYPSKSEKWSGTWYIQSKFHKPHLSKDPQKWLLAQIQTELTAFAEPESSRRWPDNWIVCTNIDPSGTPETGCFDRARELVATSHPNLERKFHIWGGRKVLDLLDAHPEVRDAYGHFLTPGHILTEIKNWLIDDRASIEDIIRSLLVTQLGEQQHTKLEQAGSDADNRPGVHKLFIDIPYVGLETRYRGSSLRSLFATASNVHRIIDGDPQGPEWARWQRQPERARVWFVLGGPGQGKSTLGQFFCQINRAAFLLSAEGPKATYPIKRLAEEIKEVVAPLGLWPSVPRIPIFVELREYAHWFSKQAEDSPKGVLTYLASKLSREIEKEVKAGTLLRALEKGSWLAIFDGLDEVPSDNKDKASREIRHFIDEVGLRSNCDLLSLCTSRPQGYSGQFDDIDCARLQLAHLEPQQAIECAKPVLSIGRSESDAAKCVEILVNAINAPGGVRELMRTPLQAHIMAVVVRDGGKPPERRWQLFNNFYEVIRRREANKELTDPNVENLLRHNEQLLRSIHNRLGFVLHTAAETSQGATTSLSRQEFNKLASDTVVQMLDDDVDEMVETLTIATEHRLVLVNTPDDGQHLRFDVRQLQEFFAAEFIYESVDVSTLRERLRIVAGDAHWREVMHFLYSALVEKGRFTELSAAVEVLEEIDDDDPNTPGRVFARRLGNGAAIAGRLLTEGVLEQDKRVRRQFVASLEPLLSQTISNSCNFTQVSQSNSRTWLISFLIQHVAEADATESIAAAAFLAGMLDDSDSRFSEAYTQMMSRGFSYIDGVLASYLSLEPAPELYQWVLRIAMDRLIDSDLASLTVESVNNAILVICRSDTDLFKSVCEAKQLRDHEVELIKRNCLRRPGRSKLTKNMEQPVELEELDYSFISGKYLADDWSHISATPMDCTRIDVDSSRGFLRVAAAINNFHCFRSRGDFLRVIEELSTTKEPLLSALSTFDRAKFPAIDRYIPLKKLRAVVEKQTESEFENALKAHQFGPFRLERWAVEFSLSRPPQLNEEFLTLIRNRPSIAIIVWLAHLGDIQEIESTQRSLALEAFRKQAVETPGVFCDFPEILGQLFDGPDSLNLREAIVRAAQKFPNRPSPMYGLQGFPFSVRLPTEGSLLPPILFSIIRRARTHRYRHDISEPGLKAVIEYAEGFALSPESLKDIATNTSVPVFQRAAAILLKSLLHDSNLEGVKDFEAILLECIAEHNMIIAEAVQLVISSFGSSTDPYCRRFVGKLFEVGKYDYELRRNLQAMLDSWREVSSAPLSNAGVISEWLCEA